MNDKEAFDYLCRLFKNDVNIHIKIQFLRLREPEQTIHLAEEHKASPRKPSVIRGVINTRYEISMSSYLSNSKH
jgi:hypothetical protein